MGNDCSQSLVYGESIDNDISVSWKKVTDSPWPLREGQCACSIGSKIYIFGGVLIDSEAPVESNDLLVFDAGTMKPESVRDSRAILSNMPRIQTLCAQGK